MARKAARRLTPAELARRRKAARIVRDLDDLGYLRDKSEVFRPHVAAEIERALRGRRAKGRQ